MSLKLINIIDLILYTSFLSFFKNSIENINSIFLFHDLSSLPDQDYGFITNDEY